MLTSEHRSLRAKIASLSAVRPPDDRELVALRQQLAAMNRRRRAEGALAELTAAERAEILDGYGDRRSSR